MRKIFSLLCVLAVLVTIYVPAEAETVSNTSVQFNEKQGWIIVEQYLSAAGYHIVELVYIAYPEKKIRFTSFVNRDLLIEATLMPNHPAWEELKNVKVGDLIWAHVGEDGKIIDIRKKKP